MSLARSTLLRSIQQTRSIAFVRYSSSSTAAATAFVPSFAPSGSTSAQTSIPYGDPSLASSAYLPSQSLSPSASAASDLADPATTQTPLNLTRKQRVLLERIIRVDQAGELGANYIYRGQLAVLRLGNDKGVTDLVQVSCSRSIPVAFLHSVQRVDDNPIFDDSTCGIRRRSILPLSIKSCCSTMFDLHSCTLSGRQLRSLSVQERR